MSSLSRRPLQQRISSLRKRCSKQVMNLLFTLGTGNSGMAGELPY